MKNILLLGMIIALAGCVHQSQNRQRVQDEIIYDRDEIIYDRFIVKVIDNKQLFLFIAYNKYFSNGFELSSRELAKYKAAQMAQKKGFSYYGISSGNIPRKEIISKLYKQNKGGVFEPLGLEKNRSYSEYQVVFFSNMREIPEVGEPFKSAGLFFIEGHQYRQHKTGNTVKTFSLKYSDVGNNINYVITKN